MHTVYLGLGTNLGNLSANIIKALEDIHERIGIVKSQSSFYSTEPWKFESENKFLNAVAEVETPLSPMELLSQIIVIEREMGRKDKSSNGVYHDRIIDIDILLYDDLVVNENTLVIPHPLMTERLFVMQPLAEIAPSVKHPVSGLSLKEIAQGLAGQLELQL